MSARDDIARIIVEAVSRPHVSGGWGTTAADELILAGFGLVVETPPSAACGLPSDLTPDALERMADRLDDLGLAGGYPKKTREITDRLRFWSSSLGAAVESPIPPPAPGLAIAVKDVCWKATPYGERENGDVAAYLVPAGALHRLVGRAQSAGISASLRVLGAPGSSEDRAEPS